MQAEGLSRYGTSFQEDLCALILFDRPFADQIFEVLDVNFLELKYLRVFVNLIKQYRAKYDVHPTQSIMKSIVRTDLDSEPEAIKLRIRDYYARILASGERSEEEAYIKDAALSFCKKQKLKEALIRSVDLINKSSFDEIASLVNGAISLGLDNNFGYDYLKDFEQRFTPKARDPVSTGWPEVDEITSGGLGRGELGVVVAPTGAGKSMVLTHLGAKALQAGKSVVHYTLELADTVVAGRYDSAITGVALSDLIFFKEKIYDELKEVEGSLYIKEYPTRSASIQTIKSHLEKMKKRGFIPDLIIVDYGDLIRPADVSKDEKRHQLETIYEELRGMAQSCECPIWTASQTNRSGLNAEVITMESISEAFNKCFVADFIFSVSRTVKDKQTNTGRIFVAKNRNGPDGVIYPIFMDTSCVKIKVLPSSGETHEDANRNIAKDQFNFLKEKYRRFKKGEQENGNSS